MFALFQAFPSWALYKYLVHILKNSSAVENCTGARLGQVVSFLIFYNIWSSWLHTFHGFDFSFRWYDGENRQMGMHLSVKWDRKTRKVKSSHLLLRSLGQVNDLFSSTGLTVCVYIGGFWPLRFYGVHFTHDSQNSFSAHHDSPTANMVDGGIMKISYNQLQKYLRHCTVVWHKWPVHDLVLVIPLHPLSKLLAIQDHTQNLEEQLWMGGRREVSIIFYRPVTRSDLKQERSFFRGSVSSFLQLVVAQPPSYP